MARMRQERGTKVYRALGFASSEFDYEAARDAALRWFKQRDAGVSDEATTVADACRAYVEDRRQSKSESCAHDAEMRFKRTVYQKPLASVLLSRLRTPAVKRWRDGLGLGKAASNRTLTTLKAALNLAVTERRVDAGLAREWGDVKPLPGASKRRDLFLDLSQRRRLFQAAKGAVADLIRAAALTGARPGELVRAKRSQLDTRTKSMTFSGKTGTRTVPLSDAALALFSTLAKSKLPSANLFVRDDGKPWGHSDWDELVKGAATDAELPPETCLYTLRHSFITEAISQGMTTLDVARLVGTSVVMIEKHYGHLVASAARERLAQVRLL